MGKLIEKAKKLLAQQGDKNGLPPFMVVQIKEIIAENSKLIPPSTLLEDVRYVVMDLETTGFNHARGDEIIAVGAVIVEGCEIKGDKSFHQLVYPCRQVPENVLKLTGIQREMLVGRLSFFGVLIEFLDFIGNSVIVGHNISFDLGFINPRLKKFCRTKIKNKTLDTIAVAEALHIPVKSYSLDNLLAFYGIEPGERHTAIGDALLTAQLLVHFILSLKERNIRTLTGLNHFLRQHANLGDEKIF